MSLHCLAVSAMRLFHDRIERGLQHLPVSCRGTDNSAGFCCNDNLIEYSQDPINHPVKSVLCMDERKDVEIMAVDPLDLLGTGLFVDSFRDED